MKTISLLHTAALAVLGSLISSAFTAHAGYLYVRQGEGTQFGNNVERVSGYAYDPAGLSQLLYSVNSSNAWQVAQMKSGLPGTNFWITGNIILVPGTNYVVFKSVTTGGAVSALEHVDYFYSPHLKDFQTVAPGGTVTLQLNDLLPLDTTFQWQLNGTDIPGATDRSLLIANATQADAGRYAVAMTSTSFGTLTSSETLLTLSALAFWGNIDGLQPPDGLTNVQAIAAGGNHIVVLNTDGTCVCWGPPGVGSSITNVPLGLSNVIAIAAGDNQSMALKNDGSAVWWGDTQSYQGAEQISGLSNIVAIGCGTGWGVALKSDGTVWQWGYLVSDHTASGVSNLVAIAAGPFNWVGLKSDGTVVRFLWQYSNSGVGLIQQADPALTGVVGIGAGAEHSLAVLSDGSVAAFGGNTVDNSFNVAGELNVPDGLSNAVAVTGGWYCSYALKNDGGVVAWGYDALGQCDVPPGLVATQVAAGNGFAVALVSSAARSLNVSMLTKQKPDQTPPTVTLLTPRPNSGTTAAIMKGFCNENTSIAHVWYTLSQPGSPTVTNEVAATGTLTQTSKHKWTFSTSLTPQPGSNTLSVQAQDVWGNFSRTATRTFIYEVPTTLNLTITGNGIGQVVLVPVKGPGQLVKLRSTGSGASLTATVYIGQTYKLVASPGAGSTFQGWSSPVSSVANQITFSAAPGMSVQASFVTQ